MEKAVKVVFLVIVFFNLSNSYCLAEDTFREKLNKLLDGVSELKEVVIKSKQRTYSSIASPSSPNNKLPNVLLIGDSISYGYTQSVRKQLEKSANVYRVADNCQHTKYGLQNIKNWLSGRTYDVIHFNFGLWDLNHTFLEVVSTLKTKEIDAIESGQLQVSPWQYNNNLEKIVKTIRETSPESKLIWAETTPVSTNSAGRFSGSELEYNKVANKVMRSLDIRINPLHSHASKRLDLQGPDGVHWEQQGQIYLATKVADEISELLHNKTKRTKRRKT